MSSYPLSNVANPFAPLTEAQQNTIIMPDTAWSNQYALTIARDSCQYMEQFLQSAGHYQRWAQADEQFVGWRPQQFWEGTRRKKANVPVLLLFSMLQSLLPNVLSTMFPLTENVDVAPRPGSTMQNASAAWELINAQLESLGEDGIKRFRMIANECFTQAFLYGNGVLEISWLYKTMKRLCFDIDWQAPRKPVYDAVTGKNIVSNVGPAKRIITEREHTYMINQPEIRCWDVRQFLIDPNCRTPFIQDAACCATVQDMTIGDLIQYRNQPGFNIPDDYTLIKLAENKLFSPSDTQLRLQASQFGAPYYYNQWTSDPYQKHIKVHRWFTRERNVWLFNYQWCAFNASNIYGFLPFLNAFYVPFPNRFHGLSLADVTEGDQHLEASLLEARLNELALAMSAPFVRKQGTMLGNSSTIPMSPSRVIDVNDEPAKAIMRLDVQGQTQQAFMEVADSERRAAKNTGLSDMAIAGVAQTTGNSANRTAAGVQAQQGATSVRIQYLVENSETSLIEPLYTIIHQFNVKFLPRDQMAEITGVDGTIKQIDPVQVLNALPRFTMRAAARMKARQQTLQIMPWLVQVVMNPELIQLMAQQQNKTLDVKVLTDWIFDVINAPKIQLWRDLTDGEKQQMNAPPPQSMVDMQKQRERLAAMLQQAHVKGDTQLLDTLIKRFLTPRAAEDMMGFSDVAHMSAMASAQPDLGNHPMMQPPPTPALGDGGGGSPGGMPGGM